MRKSRGTLSSAADLQEEQQACERLRVLELAERGLDEREGDVDHALEVLDRDALVRGVDVGHPVREVDAAQAAVVEDVRVGGATGERVAHGPAAAGERVGGEPDDVVAPREAVA